MVRTWHARFASFAQAIANLPQIHLVMLDDFVASGATFSTDLERILAYKSVQPFGRDYVGEILYRSTMEKISLTIAAVFTTRQGRTAMLNTLTDVDGLKRYRMTDASQQMAVLSGLTMIEPSFGEALCRLQLMLYRFEDEEKPFLFFAHKFSDSSSMAFRHLMKTSFRQQWQLVRIPPYKASLNKAIRYARHEHYGDMNGLTDKCRCGPRSRIEKIGVAHALCIE